jgi:hypothetical protein
LSGQGLGDGTGNVRARTAWSTWRRRARYDEKYGCACPEAHKCNVKKFDTQETEIEKLQDAIKKLQEKEHQQKQEYEVFLAGQNVE